MSTYPLAIVIPAYKSRFLAEALASIAGQTRQDFHLYICDDGSPEQLAPLCTNVLPAERITYRRFEPNMGARYVVRHWNRSVQGVAEPWVWLFSDDDIMDAACVETFLRTVESDENPASVYRFNTLAIDAAGRVTHIHAPHPASESAVEFAYHRLMRQRQSFAPEYLFRREAWERHNGFVDLPFAQGSDDASWITFAGQAPIRLLAGPRVRWRMSGANISALRAAGAIERLKGCMQFAAWLQRRFAHESPLPADLPAAFDMTQLAREWVLTMLRSGPSFFSWGDLREILTVAETALGIPRRQALRALLGSNVRSFRHTVKSFWPA